MERQAGALTPISVLPRNQGIGDFGKHTYRLVDTINKQHTRIWQILPLNSVGYENSPYQLFSSYTWDEVYISVDMLANYGLLRQSSIRNYNKFSEKVDYDGVHAFKAPYLKKVYKALLKMQDTFAREYRLFCSTAPWLYPYAVFITLKEHSQMASWTQWPEEQRERIRDRHSSLKEFEGGIRYEQFLQFIFYKQWNQVKAYANAHGVEIMGDLPFYAGLDSTDAWQSRKDFLLDPQGNLSHVAGVLPNCFSDDG